MTQGKAEDLGPRPFPHWLYDAEVQPVNWDRYDTCGLCFAVPGEPCRKQHNYGPRKLAEIPYCVTPHKGRGLVTAISNVNIFGTNAQPLDVSCDNVTDAGCGAVPGEKCHDEEGTTGDADWYYSSVVHNARYRRLMRIKLMWRAWN